MIVDEVKEVITLENDSIDKVQNKAGDEKSIFLEGVGKYKDTLVSFSIYKR